MLKAILSFGLSRRTVILVGLFTLFGAGIIAFTSLSIEAYPQPAPVIIEITAQAAGLSAEGMERCYTIPMEIGVYPMLGITSVKSTSFYGLTFLRVSSKEGFKDGVDFYFAYTQVALSLQQNATPPRNQTPIVLDLIDQALDAVSRTVIPPRYTCSTPSTRVV
jgi:cobalt-zinc-cadmium resistance protein CzcA